MNLPIGVAAIALDPVLLPGGRDRTAASRLDLLGAGTITAGLVLLVWRLSGAESAGFFGSLRTLGALAAALALILAFRLAEARGVSPLVPFGVFLPHTRTGAREDAHLGVLGAIVACLWLCRSTCLFYTEWGLLRVVSSVPTTSKQQRGFSPRSQCSRTGVPANSTSRASASRQTSGWPGTTAVSGQL